VPAPGSIGKDDIKGSARLTLIFGILFIAGVLGLVYRRAPRLSFSNAPPEIPEDRIMFEVQDLCLCNARKVLLDWKVPTDEITDEVKKDDRFGVEVVAAMPIGRGNGTSPPCPSVCALV
jgi:hypothetical protein